MNPLPQLLRFLLFLSTPAFLGAQSFVLIGTLPVPPDEYPGFPVGMSQVRAVSDDGQVAAGFSVAMPSATTTPPLGQPVVWTASGGLVALPNIDGLPSNLRGFQTVSDISPDGTKLIGRVRYNSSFPTVSQAAIWTRQPDNSWTVTGLGGIPGASVIDTRANVASTDLSVLYGFGRDGADRFISFQWTALGGIESLPLPANATSALPAGRGTSADGLRLVGSVRVETEPGSFANLPYLWDQTEGDGFLPIGAGMTEGWAEGISSEGNTAYGRAFVGDPSLGNMTLLRWQKETTGNWAVENLGSPTEGFVSNFMGVSQDGETVVFSISSGGIVDGWIHNSYGFAPLRAALESVSPAAASYQLSVLGMTSNSRHVFGSARLPGEPAIGFILTLPEGYLEETRILNFTGSGPLTLMTNNGTALILDDEETADSLEILGPDTGHGTTTLAINPGAELLVTGEAIIREGGALNIMEGGTTTITETLSVLESGSLIVNGTLNSLETNLAGSFSGNGILIGNLIVEDGGIVSPGSSPGELRINGATAFESGARLVMEIEGSTPAIEHDRLVLTGNVQLGGTLEVIWGDAFLPRHDDFFRLIDHPAGAASGTFDEVIGLEAFTGLDLDLLYLDKGVYLRVTRQLPSFDVWTEMNNLPKDQRGLRDIPFKDGLSNLVRFAFDLPFEAGVGNALLPQAIPAGEGFRMHFRVHQDIELITERSLDLIHWSEIPTSWLSASPGVDEWLEYELEVVAEEQPWFLRFRLRL